MLDLTFENSTIKKYFETGQGPPVQELLYLHQHPLHRPNFIGQLDRQLCKLGEYIISKNIKGKVVTDLENIAIKIGTSLPLANKDNAESILSEFRKVYLMALSFNIPLA